MLSEVRREFGARISNAHGLDPHPRASEFEMPASVRSHTPSQREHLQLFMTSNLGEKASTSFTTRRVNRSTFVVREDDDWKEHPLIYVKLHPLVPVIILSDTGCDEPSKKHKEGNHNPI